MANIWAQSICYQKDYRTYGGLVKCPIQNIEETNRYKYIQMKMWMWTYDMMQSAKQLVGNPSMRGQATTASKSRISATVASELWHKTQTHRTKSKFPHTPVRPLKLEVLEKQTKASAPTATTSASPKIVTLPCVALPANPFPVKCYIPLYGPLPCVTILENLKARWLPSLILRQGVHRREPREYDTSNVPQVLIHPKLFTSITRKSKEGPYFHELR